VQSIDLRYASHRYKEQYILELLTTSGIRKLGSEKPLASFCLVIPYFSTYVQSVFHSPALQTWEFPNSIQGKAAGSERTSVTKSV